MNTRSVKPRPELTTRQREVYEFVCKYVAEHGYSPSFREIAVEFDVAHSAVHQMLHRLERLGWIKSKPIKHRRFYPVAP